MSLKKAQKIADEIETATGINLASYQNDDLHFLKDKLEEFLDLDIETDDLEGFEELSDNFELDDPEEIDEEDE